MIAEIKRLTELFLCRKLGIALPGYVFVPEKGGGGTLDTDDAAELDPPFTVLSTGDNAEKTLAQEDTWYIPGTAQIITHLGDTRSGPHSRMVRAIYTVLAKIPEVTYLDSDPEFPGFSFHGIDVGGIRSAQDTASRAHADIIDFKVGVSVDLFLGALLGEDGRFLRAEDGSVLFAE